MKKTGYSVEPIYEDSAPIICRLYRENLDAGSAKITEKDFADMLQASWEGTDERKLLLM